MAESHNLEFEEIIPGMPDGKVKAIDITQIDVTDY